MVLGPLPSIDDERPAGSAASRRRWLAWAGGGAYAALGLGSLLVPAWGRAQPGDEGHDTLPWPASQAAPALSLPDLTGASRTLAEFRGKVVVLNFWATWCPPCRAEMPSLQQMADFYDRDGLQVLTVDVGESAQRVSQYLAKAGLRLLSVVDGDKSVSRAWGVRVLPTSVIIDTQGQPRHLLRGGVDWVGPEAASLIEPLLRRAPVGPTQA